MREGEQDGWWCLDSGGLDGVMALGTRRRSIMGRSFLLADAGERHVGDCGLGIQILWLWVVGPGAWDLVTRAVSTQPSQRSET